ncbi:helix-turn-helix domain-containing protein [Shewanella sp. VB17]|uniref:helix-turn-helix domain-containing protein n=1 Tax=Shewanella sp. VB17 TaxID=2739432 RepID=UPI0015675209|nr:helix-turn-helix domain-containing protein [Shewanella sp. VB17]NRD72681.1 helix-turn-helix domain-containing protein [Shewanella sp. VB17]
MSMELMVKAMKVKVGNPLRKLVLIKLADNASDSGECWPSYQHIADQCEIAKSTVRKHIKELADSGLLMVTNRKGPKGNSSNMYTLTLCRQIAPPMPLCGTGNMPLNSTGKSSGGIGGGPSDSTRISHSFEPVNESLQANVKKSSQTQALNFSSWPGMPSEQALADWMAMRKRKKSDLNQTAVNRLARHLHEAVAVGYSVDDCIAICATRGWLGFEARWLQQINDTPKVNVLDIPRYSQSHDHLLGAYEQDFNTEL